MDPLSVSVAAPALVRPNAPLIVPPTVSVLEFTVTARPAESVTDPVPRLRSLVPL